MKLGIFVFLAAPANAGILFVIFVLRHILWRLEYLLQAACFHVDGIWIFGYEFRAAPLC